MAGRGMPLGRCDESGLARRRGCCCRREGLRVSRGFKLIKAALPCTLLCRWGFDRQQTLGTVGCRPPKGL